MRQAFLKCGVLTQYIVIYQCILAIGNHTAFFMDGSLFSNRQVNLCILISNSIGFCCCWSSASCARLPSIVSGRYSCISEMHMVYYLPAQLLPHTLAGSLSHPLTHPLTHSPTHPPTHSLPHSCRFRSWMCCQWQWQSLHAGCGPCRA